MANRYWVGGTADWDGTAGTKWSATSGGAGGASVPTTADDVFFDSASTGTVTITDLNTGAKSINCTGFTGTITGIANITVAGSVTLASGMTFTGTNINFTITGTGTITSAGKQFGLIIVDGAGITVTLGDALNIGTLSVNQGTFNTANYSVTATAITSNTSNTRAMSLGSSTVTVSALAGFDISGTGLTFTAGTSQINMSNDTAQLRAGVSNTFYNVSFTSTSVGNRSITGTGTVFNNLTLVATAAGMTTLSFAANATINGTFTCAGGSATQRGFVYSDTLGTQRTLTVASLSAADCDFRDIVISGAAAGASPSRAGNCGGNSGINFPAPKTVYRVGNNTTWVGSGSWATTSGGAGSDANFPLPQDTAVIDDNTSLTGTLSTANYNHGTLDASSRTAGITLAFNTPTTRYGSFRLSSAVTVSGTQTQTFSGRSTMTYVSAGRTTTFPLVVNAPSGTFALGDAYLASNTVNLTQGTLDAVSYNLTCTTFTSSNTNVRTLSMGSGLWTVSAATGTVWTTTDITNLTFNKGSANILLSTSGITDRTFAGGALSYNKLTIGGTSTPGRVILSGIVSFTEVAATRVGSHRIVLANNIGTIDTWSATGSAGNLLYVISSVTGTRRTFNLTAVTSGIDYLFVMDIGVNQANRFYVGANSTNNGNNVNVIFTASPATGTAAKFLMLF